MLVATAAACGSSADSANDSDVTTPASGDSSQPSADEPAAEEPSAEDPSPENPPTGEPPAQEPADEEPLTDDPPAPDAPAGDIDADSVAWADALCTDMTVLFTTYMEAPEPVAAADISSDDNAFANIDYFDGLSNTTNDLLADIYDRTPPAFDGGDRVHQSWVDHVSAISMASLDGAQQMELMHRTGSPEELADAITSTQAAVDELMMTDISEEFSADPDILAAMDLAMAAAPTCALLG